MQPALAADDRERRLDEVLAEYLKAVQSGSAPSRTQLLAAHPDLADDLGSFFDDQDQLERLTKPLRSVLPPPPLAPGEIVGEYELLGELARGGMGVVYRARHRTLHRIVALKMLKAGTQADAAQLHRFRTEAEAVAHLDHPNIVPIFEVGEHQGQQYFTMKLIEGGSLADQIVPLSAQPRIVARLLADVAAAVHYAHQRGVLHRDLKPSNVLLARTGKEPSAEGSTVDTRRPLDDAIPFVTDFGLAKRVDLDNGQTQSGAIVGTPSYMAPEQAARRGVLTTAADVYGLGAILYECLTGRPPFRGESMMDTLLLVLESEPAPPRSLNPRVAADLETICLKCLEKDARQRYPSALAVAEDLSRYLVGEPIQARPIGGVERVVRFCRRQPLVALLWAVMCVGLGLTSWQWWRAEYHRGEADRQRAAAEDESKNAESQRADAVRHRSDAETALANLRSEEARTLKLLADLKEEKARSEEYFKDAHRAVARFYKDFSGRPELQMPNLEPLRTALMTTALDYYQRFLQRRGNDPTIKAELADIHARVGDLMSITDSKTKALESYEKALTLYQELAESEPTNKAHQSGLLRVRVQVSNMLDDLGRSTEGLEHLEKARVIRERLAKAEPDSYDAQISLARVYNNLGATSSHAGRKAEAEAWFEKARDLRTRLREQYPRNVELARELSLDWRNWGVLLENTRRPQEAIKAFDKAREIQEPLMRQTTPTPEMHLEMASCYRHLSFWHRVTNKTPAEALPWAEKAVTQFEPVAEANPLVTTYQEEMARMLKELAQAQRSNGKRTEAVASMDRCRQMQEKLAPLHPAGSPFHSNLAHTWFEVAYLNSELNQRAEAILAYQQCRDLRLKLVEARPENAGFRSDLGMTYHNLATQYGPRGRTDDALAALREAIKHTSVAFKQAPDAHRGILSAHYFVLAEYSRGAGKIADAVEANKERRKLWKDNVKELILIVKELARCADDVGKGKVDMSADDVKLRKQCADLSMDVLRQAVAAGFNDTAALETDAVFNSLRPRDDFQQLLADLTKKKD